MTLAELKNDPMFKYFINFTKATKAEINNEEDLKAALLRWVNHRVEITPQLMDEMYRKTVEEIKNK